MHPRGIDLQSTIAVEELRKARNGSGYSLGPNYSAKQGHTHELSKEDTTPGRTARQLMRSHGVRREGVRCNLLANGGDMYAFNAGTERSLLSQSWQPLVPPNHRRGLRDCFGACNMRGSYAVSAHDRAKKNPAEGAPTAGRLLR